MQESSEQKILTQRSAGILMHITSLPGPAYIGDFGSAAREFADFLNRSRQSVWQMLPVQPTGEEQGNSPYSSTSSMAGNPLLISIELLVQDGLLDKKDLKRGSAKGQKVDYVKAKAYKEPLLNKAWQNWTKRRSPSEEIAFKDFCAKEDYWLNDFALYSLFKHQHNNKPWYQWAEPYRNREAAIMENSDKEFESELNRIKWIQMVFDRQWNSLHKYCDSLQIQLLGDVPIYVAHDSADVWSNRDIFTIDDSGNLTEIAGVPPDLFNDEGQLWGMPLYRWDIVEQNGYEWWIKRLRKNLAWFDLIRLDHFRGFSSYWSVPASEKTAKAGKWIKGPAERIFEKLREEMGGLPFVAEDLGEIDKPVYILRDQFDLPGMNVLQFAFGDDMPNSPYLPHNYIRNSIVYTGTHDNNTTVGWFKSAGKIEKNNLAAYLGVKLNEANVSEHMIRLAYMSVSKLAVIPIQDVLSLDESARMNMPATAAGNWTWRLHKDHLDKEVEERLQGWSFVYGRSPFVP